MQVNATLIAAQQAAREAQSRFQATHVAPQSSAKPAGASFAAALGDFSASPAEQPASPQSAQAASPASFGRPGGLLDIKV